MIDEINMEREKSDRLTVAKLNSVKQFNKQDHISKLMTEKYSLLPLNPQQLTPVQTTIQRMSEKHPDFEIEPVNTIQPSEIEYTRTPQCINIPPIFMTFISTYLMENTHPVSKHKIALEPKHLIMLLSTTFCLG